MDSLKIKDDKLERDSDSALNSKIEELGLKIKDDELANLEYKFARQPVKDLDNLIEEVNNLLEKQAEKYLKERVENNDKDLCD